jgi:hypothetical protein
MAVGKSRGFFCGNDLVRVELATLAAVEGDNPRICLTKFRWYLYY